MALDIVSVIKGEKDTRMYLTKVPEGQFERSCMYAFAVTAQTYFE